MFTIQLLTLFDDNTIAGLSEVLIDAVEGGASVGFVEPMTIAKAQHYWQKLKSSVEQGERLVWGAFDAENKLIGTVTLIMDLPENQPHRADLVKLLVHRKARQQGVGEALMRAAEQTAYERGKTLLVLDTATYTAERLYQRLQWQKVGTVPNYALMPDHSLCATNFYYKILTK
ncbi:MAG: GNAT family N-acetyltransferase [Thiofilum sp.]|uniref:GNAT family N-acetyltransferase n=1 Tax=Thiofilum sp. TaxID=2212733 RepID=UPI0025EAD78C|nr:GNAT family N-acetyltransferase [Thiofilum sp.]